MGIMILGFWPLAAPITALAAGAASEAMVGRVDAAVQDRVVDIGTLPSGQSWVLTGSSLLWSEDAGLTWRTALVAPPETQLRAAQFLDQLRGWVVVAATARAGVMSTGDGGLNWNSSPIQIPDGDKPAAASASFVSPTTGYL